MNLITICSSKRKCLFGDFKISDLDTPKKRKCYWQVSQKTVLSYKKKVKNYKIKMRG